MSFRAEMRCLKSKEDFQLLLWDVAFEDTRQFNVEFQFTSPYKGASGPLWSGGIVAVVEEDLTADSPTCCKYFVYLEAS